ncbi:type I phosphomannose isomerase catalytic subunit [Pseudokineococcus basanitobsidens]|uniref:Type I phosphomannose isomerase catalytic subunit n=1 Tax=Pseudokineococcus basanitobsidens TaxID=1926649 RepID=A0ABU8RNR7_9ACTN
MTGVVRDYAWGSRTALPALLGLPADGGPQAELWLGAHPGAPARAGDEPLDALVARDAAGVLGPRVRGRFGDRLPYLLKALAADAPLSLQVHPSEEQARAGFAREDEAGLAVDAPDRSYKDPHHKPEMLVALTPFEALCGFREPHVAVAALRRLHVPEAAHLVELLSGPDAETSLRDALSYLLSGSEEVAALVEAVAAACADEPLDEPDPDDDPDDDAGWAPEASAPGGAGAASVRGGEGLAGDERPPEDVEAGAGDPDRRTVAELSAHHPGDPGVLVALLLHRVRLEPGEAVWLPAGNVHAYLSGVGVELMAASDNVLRGGLTTKHVDVAELQRVVDTRPLPVPQVQPRTPAEGVQVWRPGPDELELWCLRPTGDDALGGPADGPRVVLCSTGEVDLRTSSGALHLARGGAALVRDDDGPLRVTGEGTAWVAAVPA